MTSVRAVRRSAVSAFVVVAGLGLAGCEVDNRTGSRTATGAGVGAAAGAVTGLVTGRGVIGSTLTGAAAGAAGGFVYDQIQRR